MLYLPELDEKKPVNHLQLCITIQPIESSVMEKLKAIFAVSLFVASLIFAAPVIEADKEKGFKKERSKISGQTEHDTTAKTQYIYPAVNITDFTTKNW